MTVLLIAGSPSQRSRSASLLDAVGERLQQPDRADAQQRPWLPQPAHALRWAV